MTNEEKEQLNLTLVKLAMGYDVDEVEKIIDKDGKVIRVSVRRRHIPPDIKAIRLLMLTKEDFIDAT